MKKLNLWYKQGKKIGFLILFLCGSLVSVVFAQSGENNTLTSQIQLIGERDHEALREYYQQSRDWLALPMATGSLAHELRLVRDFSLAMLEQGAKAKKIESKATKQEMLAEWSGSMAMLDPLHQNCTGRYTTMDLMSFAYDFPTALMIAVWRKESNCGYYLPKNGDGPFQIVSKDYSKVTLNKENFEKMIQDFIFFAKHKINRYNSRNPDTPIKLSYHEFSHADLLKFAALYNGLSGATVYGDIKPAAPGYFWEKMPGNREKARRNGLFGQFLRVIEWEASLIP